MLNFFKESKEYQDSASHSNIYVYWTAGLGLKWARYWKLHECNGRLIVVFSFRKADLLFSSREAGPRARAAQSHSRKSTSSKTDK